MQIPDEVIEEAEHASLYARTEDAYQARAQVIAEWARKEALKEAEEAVKPTPMPPGFAGGWAPTESRRAFDEAARRIRALREDV